MFKKADNSINFAASYSELVFPKKIIINFLFSSLFSISAFFFIAFIIHSWAVSRNEKIFNEQQSLQVFLAKQAMEENVYEMFYSLEIIQLYYREELLEKNNDFKKNRLFQFVQTSKQEILGFVLSYSPGQIDYTNIAVGEKENIAKSLAAGWLDEFWKKIDENSTQAVVTPLFISFEYQFAGLILPVLYMGELQAVLCSVIDLKPMINRFLFPLGMGEYGQSMFLTEDGIILFDDNIRNIGKNVYTLDLLKATSVRGFYKNLLSQTAGRGDVYFMDEEGLEQRRLAAWNSMAVGNQRLVLILTASEKQVNAALFDLHLQIVILGFVLVISVAGINLFLIISRKKIVQDGARHLEVLVEERTEELALSEIRYQAIFQSANDGIMIIKENRIVNFNKRALEMFGYSEEELINKTPLEVSPAIMNGKSSEKLLKSYIDDVIEGKACFFEWVHIRKDNSSFESEVSLSLLDLGEEHFILAIIRDITERKRAEYELHKLNAELEKRVLIRTIELEESNIALKESLKELKETQKNLVEAEKMASLGMLVAGVAHEINTPVGISYTAASLLMEQTQKLNAVYKEGEIRKSELENYLKAADETAKILVNNLTRAADHISSFKKVAVDQTSREKRTFNMKTYIEEILVSLQPVLKKTTHTVLINGSKDININSMPGALSQIITNLVMNSIKHGFEGVENGNIEISYSLDNEVLSLEYSDNGNGMSEEIREKIFEPFFTTKRGSGGSGLGLHIVYNLVTQSLKGEITCKSIPEKGTKFTISWPVGMEKA